MDKKKVIELIEKIDLLVHDYIDGEKQDELQNIVAEALDELQKSDWISVEDKLPPFDERVLVTSKEDPKSMYFTYRTMYTKDIRIDENAFVKHFIEPITHWQKIKLLKDKQ